MNYYKIFYFKNNETYNIGGWAAFFFNYQLERISKIGVENKKAALSLPPEGHEYKPILINFRENVAFFIEKRHKIIPVKFTIKNDKNATSIQPSQKICISK